MTSLVVVADKDPYDLQVMQAALLSADRELLIVGDGENIITIASARSPDVVVVGQSLGQMGGFAVSRELKMLADTGEIREPKIIVLLERAADAWLADWARADAHLLKPVDPAELDELIDRLVGQPAA